MCVIPLLFINATFVLNLGPRTLQVYKRPACNQGNTAVISALNLVMSVSSYLMHVIWDSWSPITFFFFYNVFGGCFISLNAKTSLFYNSYCTTLESKEIQNIHHALQ